MKTYTVIFSAPWHDHHAGYCAVVQAPDPSAAFSQAIGEELGRTITMEERNQATLIAVFEGTVTLLNHTIKF